MKKLINIHWTAVATTGEFYLTFPTSSPPAYDRFYKVVQPDLSLAENEVHIRTLTGTEPFKKLQCNLRKAVRQVNSLWV